MHSPEIICLLENAFSTQRYIHLDESCILKARCRPMNFLGILNPSKIYEWKLDEVAAYWTGNPPSLPPVFWGVEDNFFSFNKIMILFFSYGRYYIREFGKLTNSELLISTFETLNIPRSNSPYKIDLTRRCS
jgi:hypothetical protein